MATDQKDVTSPDKGVPEKIADSTADIPTSSVELTTADGVNKKSKVDGEQSDKASTLEKMATSSNIDDNTVKSAASALEGKGDPAIEDTTDSGKETTKRGGEHSEEPLAAEVEEKMDTTPSDDAVESAESLGNPEAADKTVGRAATVADEHRGKPSISDVVKPSTSKSPAVEKRAPKRNTQGETTAGQHSSMNGNASKVKKENCDFIDPAPSPSVASNGFDEESNDASELGGPDDTSSDEELDSLPISLTRPKRKIKKVQRYKNVKMEAVVTKWSDREKRDLLRGLRKYGSRNLDALHSDMPDVRKKSQEQISQYITKLQTRARTAVRNSGTPGTERPPLEEWIEKMESILHDENSTDFSTTLQHTMLLAAMSEQQPTPEESHGVSYKNIYRYFYELMSGEPPSDPSPADAEKIVELLTKLADIMRPLNLTEESTFFNNWRFTPNIHNSGNTKTYSRKAKTEDVPIIPLNMPAEMEAVLKQLSFNPLRLPKQLIMKQNINLPEPSE